MQGAASSWCGGLNPCVHDTPLRWLSRRVLQDRPLSPVRTYACPGQVQVCYHGVDLQCRSQGNGTLRSDLRQEKKQEDDTERALQAAADNASPSGKR